MRQAIVDGLKGSVADFSASSGLKRGEVMDLVLVTQFFDYLSEVGSGRFSEKSEEAPGEVNFLYHNPGALSDLRKVVKNIVRNGALGSHAKTTP